MTVGNKPFKEERRISKSSSDHKNVNQEKQIQKNSKHAYIVKTGEKHHLSIDQDFPRSNLNDKMVGIEVGLHVDGSESENNIENIIGV